MVYLKSNSTQIQLLPANLRDIIPDDHICYLIEDVVHQLDFSSFDEKVQGPGNPTGCLTITNSLISSLDEK